MIQSKTINKVTADEILAWDDILKNDGISFEDAMLQECISLEDANLEDEQAQPVFGNIRYNKMRDYNKLSYNGSVAEYCNWILDNNNDHYSED